MDDPGVAMTNMCCGNCASEVDDATARPRTGSGAILLSGCEWSPPESALLQTSSPAAFASTAVLSVT